MYPIISIFGKEVGVYGICAAAGFLLTGFLSYPIFRKRQYAIEDMMPALVAIGLGILFGSHLLGIITRSGELLAILRNFNQLSGKAILLGLVTIIMESVYYGGFLGACAAILIYTRKGKNLPRAFLFDVFAVMVPLFHAFGRVGCAFAGCCYGIECESFGYAVHGNTLLPEVNDVVRFPVQFIEAGCNLLIFGVLYFLYRKGKDDGKMIFRYMLLYPPVRFTLEFFRGDSSRGFLFGLSTSQWISLFLFLTAVIVFTFSFIQKMKPERRKK